MGEKAFLTAKWTQLAMLNYSIDPSILLPHVPQGTELDQFQGQTFVSLVGFQFEQTRVFGIPVPFHRNFAEVNLRFYVRRRGPAGWRRGVVFLKEVVALPLVAWVARTSYDENFIVAPMRYRAELPSSNPNGMRMICYEWKFRRAWQKISLVAEGRPQIALKGSEEQFIIEHYWGYTRRRDGTTSEYRVEHPPWRVWHASHAEFSCDVARLYGPKFVEPLARAPSSAFLAEGSSVTVYPGHPIEIRPTLHTEAVALRI